MSSWFYSTPVAKINQPKAYYFLTHERWAKGLFKFYGAEAVTITTDEIKRFPENVAGKSVFVTAIPRDFLMKLNPAKDFLVKIRITNISTGANSNFGEIPLGEFITNETLKYPEYVCHAFLSAAEPTIDLGDKMVILSNSLTVPKFSDKEILDKLLKCMHEAIKTANKTNWPEFTFDGADHSVKIMVGLSSEAKNKFTGKEVGLFKLPETQVQVSETDK